MGFSVSGGFAILVVASLIAFGTLYTAGSNGFEQVSDATNDVHDDRLDRANTEIRIAELRYDGSDLYVNVTNDGSTALSANATDVLVDNEYRTRGEFEWQLVENESGTDLWLPGEELSIRIATDDRPSRAKVVTEHGVAVSAEVE